MIIPRLKTSKAWTDLPEDFKLQVTTLFQSHFKDEAKKGKFDVLGRIYKNEIVLRCLYTPKNSLRPIQFDLSTNYEAAKQNTALKTFELLVDCSASLFQSTFEDEEFGVPALWTEIDFDGTLIYAKSESINQELEDEANKLLGDEFLEEQAKLLELEAEALKSKDGLIKGDLESDEIEKAADILNKKRTH